MHRVDVGPLDKKEKWQWAVRPGMKKIQQDFLRAIGPEYFQNHLGTQLQNSGWRRSGIPDETLQQIKFTAT